MWPGPIVPPPPGLFSIRTGWPRYFAAISAKRRRWVSVEPPAGQGQIRVIGRDGNSWAAAAGARSKASGTRLRASNFMRRSSIPACGGQARFPRAASLPKTRWNVNAPRRGAGETRRIAAFPPCIMALDVSRPDLSLAVIGTGVMGRGIAQIAAQAGIRALLHDSRPGAAREAKESVSAQLARLAEKGRLERDALARAQANLVVADSREALASCPIVIEAIVEDLEAKRELLRSLEDIV